MGFTLSSYMCFPPAWRDTIIRAHVAHPAKVRVRAHAGLFQLRQAKSPTWQAGDWE
jgi:hypothetical protein